ncbi:hypothetical protein QN277_022344 [Acacia crassicarpa]|uniref:Uncharacterized protein n=1 Tax=Acacia crassicarpa TaxID=499986 RepID=A0AAE1MIM2_9FABA|nr:hypothetical protein QN277_022344 [Acacia crassicarpa]
MGCCVSTVDSSKPHLDGLKNQNLHPRSAVYKSNATLKLESRSPPAAEEEIVKKVLSETPISKSRAERNSQMPSIQPQDDKFQFDDLQEVFSTPQVPFSLEPSKIQMPIAQTLPEKFESKEEVSEVSQLSEMCNVTESFSTTTTATIGEKREDEVTSKQSNREATYQKTIHPVSIVKCTQVSRLLVLTQLLVNTCAVATFASCCNTCNFRRRQNMNCERVTFLAGHW